MACAGALTKCLTAAARADFWSMVVRKRVEETKLGKQCCASVVTSVLLPLHVRHLTYSTEGG